MGYKWDFSLVFTYINLWAKGLGITLAYSAGTILGGMIIGVVCGMLLLYRRKWVTLPIHFYVELFRCTPLLVQIVWFYYALPIVLSVELPAWLAAGLGLTLYMGAFATEIVRGVSLDVQRGQVVVIIGPSGCGKSTFLRCLNLLESPSAGTLQVGDRAIDFGAGHTMPRGRDLARFRARIGMVFQQFDLFPHMTALGNVMSGPVIVKKMRESEAETIARDLLAKVGLGNFTQRFPRELSGGQQQRVAIARAMAMAPEVMLFDEVTSALDPELVGEVLDVMKQLAADGTTMIVVTHEMAFARDVADHVVVMDAGQVVEQGAAAEVLLQPKNPRTASFLSRFHSTMGERRA